MKDGKRIVDQAYKIKKTKSKSVVLLTSAPVCSKTKTFLLEKCTTQEEKDRVEVEYELFERKEFIKVLQFLIYFVNTLRKHNMVWGVGRGSSVASFCLFLIGVHKINPIQYNIDYKEFLR